LITHPIIAIIFTETFKVYAFVTIWHKSLGTSHTISILINLYTVFIHIAASIVM
jgi:hypothetical protein